MYLGISNMYLDISNMYLDISNMYLGILNRCQQAVKTILFILKHKNVQISLNVYIRRGAKSMCERRRGGVHVRGGGGGEMGIVL